AAARLRRAQERALSSRPYVAMMESVLLSLKRHAEVYDPETGDVRHPLLLARPEKNVLGVVISGEGGFAGAFSSNIVKAATNFISTRPDQQIDVEAIGRKGRDILRRRYPAAQYVDAQKQQEPDRLARGERKRSGAVEMMDDHYRSILHKITYDEVG